MLMTGITNANIIPKDGRMSRSTAPRFTSKPFVVCSISTKRFAGSKTSKTQVQRLSPTIRPTSSGDGPHVPNEARAKGQAGRVASVVPTATKTEARHSLTTPALAPDPGPPPGLKISAPFSRLTSKDQSLSKKTIGSERPKVVERTKKAITTYSHPTTARPTQLTTAKEAPPRPSCVPRGRISRAPGSATLASKGRLEVIVKAAIPRPRNPGIKLAVDIPTSRTAARAMRTGSSVNDPSVPQRHPGVPFTRDVRLTLRNPVKSTTGNEPFQRPSCVPRGHLPQYSVSATLVSKEWQEGVVKAEIPRSRISRIKASIDIPATRTRAHGTGAGSSVNKPSVSESRPGAHSPQNERLALYTPVIYPDVNWSPPPSPDLSSFPSQSWTVAVSVDVKQTKTTTMVCSEEISLSTRETEESGSPDTPDDCRGSSESDSTSPAPSSSTAVSTPLNPEMYISGTDSTLDVGSSRKEPYVQVSPTECAAKIISRSRNGSTSADTLAKILERSQADSPTRNTDAGSTARTVRSVMEIARNLFSRSEHLPQVTPETAGFKITGTNMSRARKLLVPPLEEDTWPSPNPVVQMEIDMLRTWKKVAGGGVVNSRLERLGPLSAVAIATKLGISGPDRV